MAEQKKSNNKTGLIVVRVLLGVLAVASLIVMVIISPFGKRLMGKEDTAPETIVETIDGNIATEPLTFTTTEKTAESPTDANTAPSVSVSVPQPTQPVENPYKNYSIFINSYKFNHSEENGVTTAVAKDDENVKMTVTPRGDTSYTDLCESAKAVHGAPVSDKKLQMANPNTCYSSESNEIITTVFCIDDGNGGSIELKYQYPSDKKDYEKDFDFMVSMFSVES